jgi:hypothetical protein
MEGLLGSLIICRLAVQAVTTIYTLGFLGKSHILFSVS